MSEIINIQDKQNKKSVMSILCNLVNELYSDDGVIKVPEGTGISKNISVDEFTGKIVITLKPENYKPVIAG